MSSRDAIKIEATLSGMEIAELPDQIIHDINKVPDVKDEWEIDENDDDNEDSKDEDDQDEGMKAEAIEDETDYEEDDLNDDFSEAILMDEFTTGAHFTMAWKLFDLSFFACHDIFHWIWQRKNFQISTKKWKINLFIQKSWCQIIAQHCILHIQKNLFFNNVQNSFNVRKSSILH